MNLKIFSPSHIFAEETNVLRIIAETSEGSFGLLPQRLDCVAVLYPGILIYETQAHGEVALAVDEGILVKNGVEVLISVRQALGGTDLSKLHNMVKEEFLIMGDQEKNIHSVMAKLETRFSHKFSSFQHE